jgi:hypothetical protein
VGVRALAAVVIAAGAAFTGCYGSTEPATNITGDTATLNGQGTANNGDARIYFQLWNTKTGVHRDTPEQYVHAGASGPFVVNVRALEANTGYSFRLCGSDVDPVREVCAQTRTFTTGPLRNDWVQASWAVGAGTGFSGGVYARGEPNGENPTGTVGTTVQCDINHCFVFDGSVTCMKVQGNKAVVGAVGKEDDLGDPSPPPAQTRLVFVLDDDSGSDQTGYTSESGTTPPNCAAADLSGPIGGDPRVTSQATVRDAPAP